MAKTSYALQVLRHLASIALLICLCVLILALTRAVHQCEATLKQAQVSTAAIQHDADALPALLLAEVHSQMNGMRSDATIQLAGTQTILDRQLTALNTTIAAELGATRTGLLSQTGDLGVATSKLFTDLDTQTLPAANALIKDPEIPKLIHDTRFTLAFAGQSMRHFDTVTDQMAIVAPAFAKSATGIAADVHGISTDVRIVTDEYVAPKPWYKKLWNLLIDAGALSSLAR